MLLLLWFLIIGGWSFDSGFAVFLLQDFWKGSNGFYWNSVEETVMNFWFRGGLKVLYSVEYGGSLKEMD